MLLMLVRLAPLLLTRLLSLLLWALLLPLPLLLLLLLLLPPRPTREWQQHCPGAWCFLQQLPGAPAASVAAQAIQAVCALGLGPGQPAPPCFL
jgi:hypothetical protein